MRPYTEATGSCIFRSARYAADFETEKPLRDIFVKPLKALGVRHRKAYNTRHTYATMLLMAGANINWVASQLGNSPLVVATVYAKWINGQADKDEMAKLYTSASAVQKIDAVEATTQHENTEKNSVAHAVESVCTDEKKKGIGGKLAEKNLQSAQIIEFKRKGWSGRHQPKRSPNMLIFIDIKLFNNQKHPQ